MKNIKHKALLLPVTAGLLFALSGCSSPAPAPAPSAPVDGAQSPAANAPQAPAEAAPQAPELTVPEASEIFPRTLDSIKTATSVSLSGDMKQGSETMELSFSGSRDGSNTLAEVGMKGANVKILIADGGSYLKADKSFFAENAGEGAAEIFDKLAGDKWISVKDASQFGDFSLGKMLDDLGDEDFKAGSVTDSSLVDLDGVPAFKYTTDEASLWIAAEGEPQLLQISGGSLDSGASGLLTFKDWNAVAPHAAPAQDETISIPGL